MMMADQTEQASTVSASLVVDTQAVDRKMAIDCNSTHLALLDHLHDALLHAALDEELLLKDKTKR